MKKQQVDDLMHAFRKTRGQLQTSVNDTSKGIPNSRKGDNVTSEKYSAFLGKYHDIENSYADFSTQDLLYFFREKAKESGYKYVITNFKRDMGIFKKVRENFEISEILLMIEFIFSEEQDYLDASITQPTILTSNWVNTIFKDSIDWANDSYISHENRNTPKNSVKKREWKKTSEKEKLLIGEWE